MQPKGSTNKYAWSQTYTREVFTQQSLFNQHFFAIKFYRPFRTSALTVRCVVVVGIISVRWCRDLSVVYYVNLVPWYGRTAQGQPVCHEHMI